MIVTLREAEILAPGDGTSIPLPGATIVFKARSSLGVSDFLVAEFTAEPGVTGPRPHRHRGHEALFSVLEGAFDVFVEDQTVRLGAGSCVTVPPGVLREHIPPAGSASSRREVGSAMSTRSTSWWSQDRAARSRCVRGGCAPRRRNRTRFPQAIGRHTRSAGPTTEGTDRPVRRRTRTRGGSRQGVWAPSCGRVQPRTDTR